MVTTETVHKEIREIQSFIDEIPVVEETLRKAPRVIGAVGTDIETFNDAMRDQFEADNAAHVTCEWDVAPGSDTFLALLTVSETATERDVGTTVSLSTRPLNKDEIQSLDEELLGSDDFHCDGLTKELLDDLQNIHIPS